MDTKIIEVPVVESDALADEQVELNQLQLSMVGGGIGDTILH